MEENYKITNENYCNKCPECGYDWFKYDLIDTLMVSNKTREQAIIYAKQHYNWTEENPVKISNLNFIELTDGDSDFNGVDGYYQCESCQISWHSKNGVRTDRYKITVAPTVDMDKLMKRLKEHNEANEAQKLLARQNLRQNLQQRQENE